MRSVTAQTLQSSVTELMDALDQRINSNTLLLALETDSDLDTDAALEQRVNDWINGPLFPAMLNEAEQLRQWSNHYAEAILHARVQLPLQPISAEDFRNRLWRLLQEVVSFYNMPVSPHRAHNLIVQFLTAFWGYPALDSDVRSLSITFHPQITDQWRIYDMPIASFKQKLRRYFDGFEHDSATLWSRDRQVYLLLTNGSD
jgi:hypothetical protein